MIMNCVSVGVGGAIGAVARYLLSLLPINPQNGFTPITLGINAIGAFCLCAIVALAGRSAGFDPRMLLFLKVGLCGGFTTFSTFSMEAVELIQNRNFTIAILYIALSVILCLSAFWGARVLFK